MHISLLIDLDEDTGNRRKFTSFFFVDYMFCRTIRQRYASSNLSEVECKTLNAEAIVQPGAVYRGSFSTGVEKVRQSMVLYTIVILIVGL